MSMLKCRRTWPTSNYEYRHQTSAQLKIIITRIRTTLTHRMVWVSVLSPEHQTEKRQPAPASSCDLPKEFRSQVQNKFCLNLYALITWFSPRHTKPFDWFSSFEKLCIVILWSKMRKKNTRKGHPVYWKPKAEVFFHLCFGSKLKPQPAAGGTCSVCC